MWPSRMNVEPRVQRWLIPFPVLKQVAHSLASIADSLGLSYGNEKKDMDSRQSLKDAVALKFHLKSLLLVTSHFKGKSIFFFLFVFCSKWKLASVKPVSTKHKPRNTDLGVSKPPFVLYTIREIWCNCVGDDVPLALRFLICVLQYVSYLFFFLIKHGTASSDRTWLYFLASR